MLNTDNVADTWYHSLQTFEVFLCLRWNSLPAGLSSMFHSLDLAAFQIQVNSQKGGLNFSVHISVIFIWFFHVTKGIVIYKN